MKKCTYAFTERGIDAFERDCLDDIFSALDETNKYHTIDELDVKITIGHREIVVPCCAYPVTALFDYLRDAEEDYRGEGMDI